MKTNNELKEIYNKNCVYYYVDGTIKTEGFDFNNILLDEKSFENTKLLLGQSHSLVGSIM